MAKPELGRGYMADFRNEHTFPDFANCPEREVDLNFYDVIDDKVLKPKYHWCLLAEVVRVKVTAGPDVLILRDKAGLELPMLLSIPHRYYDVETIPEKANNKKHRFRAGKCVAILYPIQHNFLSGDVGIRLAVESWAKVIPSYPCSLEKLLLLSDTVKAQNIKVDGQCACHACGKRDRDLMKCGRCNLVWYCDAICQQVGWNQKGHKEDCKILKDPDIQGMFAMKWDVYESSVAFPLGS